MDDQKHHTNHWFQALRPDHWRGFTYIGTSARSTSEGPPLVGGSSVEPSTFSLATATTGDRVQIVALPAEEANSRLMGMGLMPGVVLEVMSVTATGSVIVALNDHRFGLGTELAQRIQVKPYLVVPTEEGHRVKLRDAAIGATLNVVGYAPTARDYKRKLLAMGFTPGTAFTVKRHAPLGDPTEVELRGFRLSLRKDEADALIVESVGG